MPIKPEVRELYHSGTGQSLETFRPAEPAFCFCVRALIGPTDKSSADIFDFGVCSPAWLAQEADRVGVVEGRHFFVMKDYDGRLLEAHVRKLVARTSGPDWNSVASKIGRWAFWEFEDYQSNRISN